MNVIASEISWGGHSARLGRTDPLDFWNLRNPLPTGVDLASIMFASGQFVATGEGGTILLLQIMY